MTLTELRYIVAIDEHRHFGRAADACHVTQPTLSVAVRKLEDELEVRLFERSRTDVIVTVAGAAIVEQARAVLNAAEQITTLAEAARNPLGGVLKLGVIYTIGPWLVPKLIGALKTLAPDLRLTIEENFTDTLATRLRQGELDCAIMSTPFSDPALVSRALYEEPFQVALPADHALTRLKTLTAAHLADETMLLLKAGNCFRDQVVEVCPDCIAPRGAVPPQNELQQTLESSSLDTICQMVAAGAGITVLPATMRLSEDLAAMIALRPFRRPSPSRTVAVYYRRGYARPPLIHCLAEAVAECGLDGVRYYN